jgi:hypothetical protein
MALRSLATGRNVDATTVVVAPVESVKFVNLEWSRGESNPRPPECDPIFGRREPPTTDHNCRNEQAIRTRRLGGCGELWHAEPVEKA